MTLVRYRDRAWDRYTVAELIRDLREHRDSRIIAWTGHTAVEVGVEFILTMLAERRMLRRHRWLSPYRLTIPHDGYGVICHQKYWKIHHYPAEKNASTYRIPRKGVV